MTATRFPIRFDAGYAWLSRALFISPADSYVEVADNYVEVADNQVSVRMAWAFRATFARSCVSKAVVTGSKVLLSRGVHGWAGRWIVNGAGDGIIAIALEPRQRAHVMGVPVSLRQLLVSVDDPHALAAALGSAQH
jgi:hypothetical protein